LLATAIVLTGCCQYKMVQTTASHIPVDQRAESIKDKGIAQMIKPFEDVAVKVANEVIGYTDQELLPGRPEGLLSNFFADVLLSYGQRLSAGKVDFALTNPGGLRKPIPKGNITVGTIYELMPFENALVVLDLTGVQVQELADSVASHHGSPVSGIKFGIKKKKAVNVLIQGNPLDLKAVYRVVANDYIAKGNDFFFTLTKATKMETLSVSMRDAIIGYIRQQTAAGKIIHIELDGREYEEK